MSEGLSVAGAPSGSEKGGDSLFDVLDEGGAEVRVEDEVRERLVRHLLGGRSTSELGQSLLAVVAVTILWGAIPGARVAGWLSLFLLVTAGRALHRRRVVGRDPDVTTLHAVIRTDVWMSAFMWAAFNLLFVGAGDVDLAILMIVVAGLIAAATSTLVADTASFHGFLGVLIGSLAVAVLVSGVTTTHLELLLLMALFTPFMVSVQQRAHVILQENLSSNARLRISEEETAHSRDFLNALVSHAPRPIVVLDRDGHVQRVNPAFEHVTGHSWGEVHGRVLSSVLAEGEDAEALASFLDTIREGARSIAELRLRRAGGPAMWMRLSGTVAGRQAAGSSIVIGEDVTDQVLAREAQTAARLEAERAGAAKSSFLATMSHEIRTPMNGIMGMVELLRDTPLTDEQRDSLRIIKASADGLLRILNDVLDLSKIEAGQLDLESVDFDLHEVLAEVGRVFALPASSKGAELIVDVGPDVPRYVQTDPHRLRQVLSNLVSNAIKFTQDGEVVLSVRAEADGEGGVPLRFSVRDTGIGISPDKHEAVFGEFEQADASTTRVHGGTGLGLTISRRLVRLLGSDIELDSEPGVGSDFHFELTLPVAEAPQWVRHPVTPPLRGRRFLVVDDNATARKIVHRILAAEGASVEEASDADAGLEALGRATADGGGYDGIVLDHSMPGKDGFDFAAEVRADTRFSDVRILMATSAPVVAAKARARDMGIGAYLAKPLSRRDLIRALRGLMGSAPPGDGERRLITSETLAAGAASIRVLLAEDNPVNQQVAEALLRRRGYDVDVVQNGGQAVEAALSERYDVVLMDVQMPGMDGLEATRRIREQGHLAGLPVIALTAHALAEERTRAERAGMNDFLAKPFEPEVLYATVERWAGVEERRVVLRRQYPK